MVDMDKVRADMAMAGTEHLAMGDTDIARADMVMKMMDTKTKMTLPAMITKNMVKTMKDIAMETVDTVMIRGDMAMETVDTVSTRADMVKVTVIMVTVKVDTDTETMDTAMETVDTIMMADMVPPMVDMTMAKVDTEEVTDIQTIQAQRTVIKVIPRVTYQDPRTVQKATAETNDYFNQTSDFQ